MTQAAKEFSLAQHREVNQTDLITLHQEFISACVFGPAEITVTVISRGRQYSTLRIQLFQHPSRDRTKPPILRIEALVHQSSLARESASSGLSLPTRTPSSKWPLLDRSTCIERKDPPSLYERRTAYGKVVFMLGPETNEVGKGVGQRRRRSLSAHAVDSLAKCVEIFRQCCCSGIFGGYASAAD